MNEPKLEFYVLNYDFNRKKVITYNVFDNISVYEKTLEELKKYVRSPKKYKKERYREKDVLYGFEALCDELRSIIMWQEWSRREYEISVGDAFEEDCSKLEKWDCYKQALPNIEVIAREVLYQYKKWLKEKNNANKK